MLAGLVHSLGTTIAAETIITRHVRDRLAPEDGPCCLAMCSMRYCHQRVSLVGVLILFHQSISRLRARNRCVGVDSGISIVAHATHDGWGTKLLA